MCIESVRYIEGEIVVMLPSITERCFTVVEAESVVYEEQEMYIELSTPVVVLQEFEIIKDQGIIEQPEEAISQEEPKEEFLKPIVKPVKTLKKRGRASMPPTKLEMNTRSLKRRKIDEEIAMEEDFESVLDNIQEQGASCLKYEFVKKRDGKKILLAKRCSVRNQAMGLDTDFKSNPLSALEANKKENAVDMSFEYNPSAFEKLFAKDGKS